MFSRLTWPLPAQKSSGLNSDGASVPPPGGSFIPGSSWMHRFSGWDEDKDTTRYLSARTLLSVGYAQEVMWRVVNERFRALAPSYGANIAVVAKWALSSLQLRARRDRDLLVTLGVSLLLCMALLLVWPWGTIFVMVTAVAAAARIVAREYRERVGIICDHMLDGRFDPSSAPEPATRALRERLAIITQRRTGNLIVFRDHSAFVGSGERLSKEHLVIDVSKGTAQESKNGKLAKPDRFTNADVHAAIISAMKKLGLAKVRVEERLFVNGKHIHNNTAILPRPKEPPSASVDGFLLQQAALHPTPDARVYVCVEMPSWQGQLVVTMFARAVHAGGSLYIEWRFHVLLPVRRIFQKIDRGWDERRSRSFRQAFRYAFRNTLHAFFGAPARVFMTRRAARIARKENMAQAYAIDHGQVFDYGAGSSIREDASGLTRQHYFLGRDETMFVLLAQEKLIRAINAFLQKKHIDTGQLEPQIKVIFEETHKHYSMHFGGNVSNSTIAMGQKAQAKGVAADD